MKQVFGLLLLCAAAFSGQAAAEVRIAVISAPELVTNSPQFKSAEAAMRKEFETRAKDLEGKAKKLAEDIKNFQRDADILSSAERAKREKDLGTRRVDQGYAERQFNEDLQTRRQQLFQSVLANISEVIKEVAKEGKYDLVVQDPVYADDSIDITQTVLKRLNDKS